MKVKDSAPAELLPDAVAAATADLARAEEQVALAQQALVTHLHAALPSALRVRDLRDALRLGLLKQGELDWDKAEQAYLAAKKGVDEARVVLRRAEQHREQVAAVLTHNTAEADHARRRAWVAAHRRDLVDALGAAETSLQALAAQPFVHDSASGRDALAAARRRVRLAQAGVEQAALQAP